MNPIAVLISDVHFSLNTLVRATYALEQAVNKANELDVELVIAGDLHDTKANLRAECIDGILPILWSASWNPIILVGNHDLLNEKSEKNALGFCQNDAWLMPSPIHNYFLSNIPATFIPYFSDVEKLREELKNISTELIIMHQGLIEATPGHYSHDKTAISLDDVKGHRIISGHYHERQTIMSPDGNTRWDFLGNPYTLGFGEAVHSPKGFHILYDDLRLEFVELNLPRHTILEYRYNELSPATLPPSILLVRVSGPGEILRTMTKKEVADKLNLVQDFKLEFKPDNQESSFISTKHLSFFELLDSFISGLSNTTDAQKSRLKDLSAKLLVSA